MKRRDKKRGKRLRKLVWKGVRCTYCGCRLTPSTSGRHDAATWDHVQPLILGGYDKRCNIVPCCAKCNRLKGKKTLQEFMALPVAHNEAHGKENK